MVPLNLVLQHVQSNASYIFKKKPKLNMAVSILPVKQELSFFFWLNLRSCPELFYELLPVYFLIVKDGKRPLSVLLFSVCESWVPCYSERKVILITLERKIYYRVSITAENDKFHIKKHIRNNKQWCISLPPLLKSAGVSGDDLASAIYTGHGKYLL